MTKLSTSNRNKTPKSKISVYRNLSANTPTNDRKNKRALKKAEQTRRRVEELASMPKEPLKRFLWKLHPKRVFRAVFSKRGAINFLRFCGVMVLIGIVSFGAIYMYYRREISNLNPEDVSKNIHTTVNRYLDRNGQLLWEDKGDDNYKLVVKSEEISSYIKKATVAIEDRSFYDHHGVSIAGLARALVNNVRGGSVQGGSTLTQQLIKQVFFTEEAHERGIKGIPRKIKEMILAMELERMYSKDQILTMYLNESSYGGRRNGVESGAQTYFGKSAKDVTLAEAALLASIPNNPSLYNPYFLNGNEYLIKRQHKVLNDMVETGAITQTEANEAKAVAILDTIKPESSQWQNIKAPHFVLEVKDQVEQKLGLKVVRAGGLTIKTTLDLGAQQAAEAAVEAGSKLSAGVGADNLAMGSVDVQTGQVIAMVGSIDFFKAGYGQRNAATSKLEPGSSIKPIADFAPLFAQREGLNYGPGSILKDEDIRNIYCVGSSSNCNVQNYTKLTYGDITIRKSLANSLNRPAIKAMYIVGVDKAIDTARRLGDKSYCVDNTQYGLSAAIGGGCTLRLIEHANAYASLARGGRYLPLSYILEITNNSNSQLFAWKESQPENVIDEQAAYMVTDILSDAASRNLVFGASGYGFGFVVPGVWTASKTGTTDNGAGRAKDSWMMSYSSKIATGVWSGNHDGAPLTSDSNIVVRRVINNYMEAVHKNVYQPQGKWAAGEKVNQPSGIKKETFMGVNDIWPSWFNASTSGKKETIAFDSVSKKKATACTPEAAKVNVDVWTITDPSTKKEQHYASDGYDVNAEDDVHKCSDTKPNITNMTLSAPSGNSYKLSFKVIKGTGNITKLTVQIGSKTAYDKVPTSDTVEITHTFTTSNEPITVTVQDNLLYKTTKQFTGPSL